MHISLAVAALAATSVSVPAAAAVVSYDAVFDASDGEFSGPPGRTGTLAFNYPITVNLAPGDTLIGNYSFKDGQSATLFNDDRYGGPEFVVFYFFGNDGPVFFENEITFTGITGDYVGPATLTGSLLPTTDYFGNIFGARTFANLTNSSFSFTGVSFRTTYLAGSATSFEGGSLVIPGPLGPPAPPVPEPATWGMMLVGFGAMGHALRRRAKVRTAVTYA